MTNTYLPEPGAAAQPLATAADPASIRRPAFFRSTTWRAFGYHAITLLLAPLALAYAVSTVVLGSTLLVTVVGLIVTAAMVVAARYWGTVNRSLTSALLHRNIEAPPPFTPRPGFFGYLRSGLADTAGWRAVAHMAVSFVTATTAAILSITFLVTGLGCMTHWYWSQWLPPMQASDGTWHRGTMIAPDVFLDGFWWQAAYAAVGVLMTFVLWPAVNNGSARLQAALSAALLGPTAAQRRVQDLEASRSSSVNTADARLAQIERDLHDGTQAQLVAIAMKLGDAKERLASAEAAADLQHLLDSAHGTAKDALADLRGIARGIRPAVLSDGLDAALESLAATAPVPVELTYRLTVRPSPAVEAIAYYCAAELVTNAVKHSRGTQLRICVAGEDSHLLLEVVDDGVGGANPEAGTGLAGLAERVRTVDGALAVSSPLGGPTTVTVRLPLS
ncbi:MULTISPECIES: sensor histidine kinase [Arthrobacter]|uniref:histidine kinase n=1 Tax=Arthrobacter caoxuetaonis TaxID=2886935 RepID=A0A9X1MDR9_9MICC|nr:MULTISPECIES: sensor histidine kinase [Arthrobacter]MCC3282156.1 sensor domain-containing protein [Arthrobacter caoxuetaonis]MCC3297455.1 sensor domain-containing protein [Arthrobacter caoxuetaonis]MCC9194350.1 sensor domain-containing protein [Arthrobacter sp. zg-Y916]USQ58013.1 sensor domain-containing protein [Arthrobacter caoxuetaonis]